MSPHQNRVPDLVGLLRNAARPALWAATVAAAGFCFVELTQGRGLGARSASGYAEAIHHSIAPVALGKVASISVRMGQRVKAGDALCVMDGRELRAAREKAAAQLQQMEATVAASMLNEEFQVTRGELWVLKARADEHGDRAALAELKSRVARLDGLVSRQLVPATELETAREKQRALEARVATYDQAKGRGQAGLDRAGAGDHQHRQAVDVQVEPVRLAVDVQRAALRQLDVQIDDLVLRAPADGVVTSLSHHEGDVVAAGTEVLALVSGCPGVVVASFPEAAAPEIEPGREVTLRRRAFLSPALHGRAIEVAPEIDETLVRARPSPNVPVWSRRVTIQLADGVELLPGEAFDVSLD